MGKLRIRWERNREDGFTDETHFLMRLRRLELSGFRVRVSAGFPVCEWYFLA
jgi:hypothetical protein